MINKEDLEKLMEDQKEELEILMDDERKESARLENLDYQKECKQEDNPAWDLTESDYC